ncbi:hypothetical protein V1505DRAFT_386823 [Lipomyces doorenjongii]
MAANTTSNNPFASYIPQRQPEAPDPNDSTHQADTEVYEASVRSFTRNINSPPPAYFPPRNTQRDVEANLPPPYERSRDRSTYTDSVPLQNLRPLDGPIPTSPLAVENTNTILNENPKYQARKKGSVCLWIVFFMIGIVGGAIATIIWLVSARNQL